MGKSLLRVIQVLNAVSMLLFVMFCIHSLSSHSNAQPDGGALSLVVTEENDNGTFLSFSELIKSSIVS